MLMCTCVYVCAYVACEKSMGVSVVYGRIKLTLYRQAVYVYLLTYMHKHTYVCTYYCLCIFTCSFVD